MSWSLMGVKGLKGKLTIQRSAHWKFSGFPMSSLVILFLVFFLLFDALLLLSFLSLAEMGIYNNK